MATFRFNPTILFMLVFSLACISREGAPEAASAPLQEAKIEKIQIEHVTPRPDFVGKLPTVLEWTAAPGADSYAVAVENEIEIPVFDQDGIKGTSTPWPKDFKIEPGTYYWRIVGLKGDRVVADSGRAAFVVHEP
jgi:hypothetical protein